MSRVHRVFFPVGKALRATSTEGQRRPGDFCDRNDPHHSMTSSAGGERAHRIRDPDR